jgi:hypothetical protein
MRPCLEFISNLWLSQNIFLMVVYLLNLTYSLQIKSIRQIMHTKFQGIFSIVTIYLEGP